MLFGRYLKIDLTSGEIRTGQVPAEYVRETIGGSGLGARLLWDTIDPARDPLDPASPLLWVTGPLTGSNGPTTARSTLVARSPHTGLWGEANIGGFVGPELRFAGYDILWLTGRAPEPVYLWIFNERVELHPAGHLWGRADTFQTQDAVRAEVGEPKARVACIGRAGETLSPLASILSDHGRLAGRTGMGAVMGSKNLKAIAVRGSNHLPLPDPSGYRRLALASNKALLDHNMTEIFRVTGTSGSADYFSYLGDMPNKYWTQGTFENSGNITGTTMADTILTGTSACQGCVISCGRKVTIHEGGYATRGETKGPEYETICAFGSQLLVDDLGAITALNSRCDQLGLDAISAGNTIALAYLMFECGIISPQDTGGHELRFGDPQPCFALLEQMSERNGLGAVMSSGSKALASHYGAEDLAVQVNNLEVPMHDPRANTSMGLVYVTSPRGACHNMSDYFMVETGGAVEELDIAMTDRFESTGKAQRVARHQDFRSAVNSLVTCYFASTPPPIYAELLSSAMGEPWTLAEMMRAGERVFNLKRLYNLRHGLTRASEKLPRLLLEPLPDGGQLGNLPDMDTLLREYYAARRWDPLTGAPCPEKIAELGLSFAL